MTEDRSTSILLQLVMTENDGGTYNVARNKSIPSPLGQYAPGHLEIDTPMASDVHSMRLSWGCGLE
jgi:hypothetical protein